MTVLLSGVEIDLNASLSQTIQAVLQAGSYELTERDMVSHTLRPWDTVLELGAGLGVISTLCARKIGSHCVHAYEANPQMIPLIRETYRRNGVKPFLHNAILGDHVGEADFYLHDDFWRSSTVPFAPSERVKVPVVHAYDVFYSILPTFLVCDIEGGEAGLFKTLTYPESLKKIVVEVHPQIIGEKAVDRLLADFYAQGFELGADQGNVWMLAR
jgi:FkbM family methyltransferase